MTPNIKNSVKWASFLIINDKLFGDMWMFILVRIGFISSTIPELWPDEVWPGSNDYAKIKPIHKIPSINNRYFFMFLKKSP